MRLKSKEVKAFRAKLLEEQGGICTLCNKPIPEGQDTLDHCHTSGRVRAVLHRSCNGAEGRIKHWARRSGAKDAAQFLKAILLHWGQDYGHLPLHPTHCTDAEKEIKQLKRRIKRLKTAKGKQKLRARIIVLERNGE